MRFAVSTQLDFNHSHLVHVHLFMIPFVCKKKNDGRLRFGSGRTWLQSREMDFFLFSGKFNFPAFLCAQSGEREMHTLYKNRDGNDTKTG